LTTSPVVNAVIEKIVEKEFVIEASDIQFTNLKEGNKVNVISPDTEITVLVTGPSSVISQLKKDDLVLTSDLSTATEGINDVKVECVTEKTVNSIALTQELISVEITESPTEPETEQ